MGQNILKLIKLADIITLINALLGFASIINDHARTDRKRTGVDTSCSDS